MLQHCIPTRPSLLNDDTIDGGADDDAMFSGSGHDTFVFGLGHGSDTIKDFAGGYDVIDLTTQGGDTIRLENIDATGLDAEDFVFQEPPVEPEVVNSA